MDEPSELRQNQDLSCLRDLDHWRSSDERQQDRAIEAIAAALSGRFEWLSTGLERCGPQATRCARFRHLRSAVELSLIPGGAREVYQGFLSTPAAARRVAPFLLGRETIDEATWRLQIGAPPSAPKQGLDLAQASAWLSELGDQLRLPTEDEWEHACWAGAATRFFWGAEVDDRYLWYADNSGGHAHPCAEHREHTNAFGLIDMVGNVWELCAEGHANGGAWDSHAYALDLRFSPSSALDPRAPVGLRVARNLFT